MTDTERGPDDLVARVWADHTNAQQGGLIPWNEINRNDQQFYYDGASYVLTALEPVFQQREQAAKIQVIESIKDQLHTFVNSQENRARRKAILDALDNELAATTDTAADRTEGGTE